jgi:hypothetical protein
LLTGVGDDGEQSQSCRWQKARRPTRAPMDGDDPANPRPRGGAEEVQLGEAKLFVGSAAPVGHPRRPNDIAGGGGLGMAGGASGSGRRSRGRRAGHVRGHGLGRCLYRARGVGAQAHTHAKNWRRRRPGRGLPLAGGLRRAGGLGRRGRTGSGLRARLVRNRIGFFFFFSNLCFNAKNNSSKHQKRFLEHEKYSKNHKNSRKISRDRLRHEQSK